MLLIFKLALLHTHIYVMAKFQVWMSSGLAVIAYTKTADTPTHSLTHGHFSVRSLLCGKNSFQDWFQLAPKCKTCIIEYSIFKGKCGATFGSKWNDSWTVYNYIVTSKGIAPLSVIWFAISPECGEDLITWDRRFVFWISKSTPSIKERKNISTWWPRP